MEKNTFQKLKTGRINIVKNAKPKRVQGTYSQEFRGSKMICNFIQSKAAVLSPQEVLIYDLCDGNRTVEDVWRLVSQERKTNKKESFSVLVGGKTLRQIISLYRKKKEISYKLFLRILYTLAHQGFLDGLMEHNPFLSISLPPLEIGFCPKKKRLLTLGMPEIAIKKLEVSIFIDNLFLSNFSKYPEDMVDMPIEKKEILVESIFKFIRENNFGGVFLKLFACKESSLKIALEIFRLCRIKSVENFVEISLCVFSDWKAINDSLAKELRQMMAKLVFNMADDEGIKNSQRTIGILNKYGLSFLVMVPVKEKNLEQIKKMAISLSSRKIPFAFCFPDGQNFPEGSKRNLINILSEVYSLARKDHQTNVFSSLLGKNISLSMSRCQSPFAVYFWKKDSLASEFFLNPSSTEMGENCKGCCFFDLCQKSFPFKIDYCSHRENNVLKHCDLLKEMVPNLLQRELRNTVLNKKR